MSKPRQIGRIDRFTPVSRVKKLLYKKPDNKKDQDASKGFAKQLHEALQKVDQETEVVKHRVMKANELLTRTILLDKFMD